MAVWLILISAVSVSAQTFSNNRIGMNRMVRDLTLETQTTYLPDTTLNRIINLAQFGSMLALGYETKTDVDTIVTTRGKHEYSLASDAIAGMISSVRRRTESIQGGGDVALIQMPPDQIGKIQDGVIPSAYSVRGSNLLVSTVPIGGDTLFVDYIPQASTLSADTSSLTINSEDQPALVMMAAFMTYARDHQTDLATLYFQAWQAMVGLKRPQQQQPQAGQ